MKNYFTIVSPSWVKLFGVVTGEKQKARAAAIFPFIFVRSQDVIEPWLINHELIHFRQQLETLFIGFYILYWCEIIHAKIILKKSWPETYKWLSSEQEAYLNQNNSEYLENRKFGAMFWFVTHKKKFDFKGPGKIIIK